MPLLDHFHPPLSVARHWESFHARWASSLADALNRDLLPERYFAEEQVSVGGRVEVDVATFDKLSSSDDAEQSASGSVATMPIRTWTPPAATFVMPAIFPESVEVLIINSESGPTLVAAIELVSPGNKDRPEYRRAFASKCASYVQQGVGLVVIDIVTSRQANLHNELANLLDVGSEFLVADQPLYTCCYRPVNGSSAKQLEVWVHALALGEVLPTVPLPLDRGICVPLELESTYLEVCERRRLS